MQRFLWHIKPGHLRLPGLLVKKDAIRAGAPMLNFLRTYCQRKHGWHYPSAQLLKEWLTKRAISNNSLKDVNIRKVNLGTSSFQEIHYFKGKQSRRPSLHNQVFASARPLDGSHSTRDWNLKWRTTPAHDPDWFGNQLITQDIKEQLSEGIPPQEPEPLKKKKKQEPALAPYG